MKAIQELQQAIEVITQMVVYSIIIISKKIISYLQKIQVTKEHLVLIQKAI